MTPNEEIALTLIKRGKIHTIYQIIKELGLTGCSNYSACLDSLARKGKIKKGSCPKCEKKGYYEMC